KVNINCKPFSIEKRGFLVWHASSGGVVHRDPRGDRPHRTEEHRVRWGRRSELRSMVRSGAADTCEGANHAELNLAACRIKMEGFDLGDGVAGAAGVDDEGFVVVW